VDKVECRVNPLEGLVKGRNIQYVPLNDLRSFLHMATQLLGSAGQTPELDRLLLEQRCKSCTDVPGPTCQQNNRPVLFHGEGHRF
jgi:hypothetical protein